MRNPRGGSTRHCAKVALIAHRVAYTGSQNLVDPRYFKRASGAGQWVDAMMRIEGPAVESLAGTFERDWSLEIGAAFARPPARASNSDAVCALQVVPSGPDSGPSVIRQLLVSAVYAACSELIITTPYFVPDEAILTGLVAKAQQGVEVTIVLPAKNDSLPVRYASAAAFEELLAGGVRIARFNRGLRRRAPIPAVCPLQPHAQRHQVGAFGTSLEQAGNIGN